MQVRRRKNESSENLIKRFVRKIKKEKIIDEFLDRRYFKKPSQIRRARKRRLITIYSKIFKGKKEAIMNTIQKRVTKGEHHGESF